MSHLLCPSLQRILIQPQNDVSNVPNVPNVSTSQSSLPAHSAQSDVPPAPALPVSGPIPSTLPFDPNVPNVPSVSSVPFPQNSPPAHSPQSDVSSDAAVSIPDPPPVPNIPNVSNVSSASNPAHSTSEVAQQPAETAPASVVGHAMRTNTIKPESQSHRRRQSLISLVMALEHELECFRLEYCAMLVGTTIESCKDVFRHVVHTR